MEKNDATFDKRDAYFNATVSRPSSAAVPSSGAPIAIMDEIIVSPVSLKSLRPEVGPTTVTEKASIKTPSEKEKCRKSSSSTGVEASKLPSTNAKAEAGASKEREVVRLRRTVGLLEGVSLVTGVIIGSGIFVSPVGVIRQVGSVGASLLVWFWCGVSSTLLALCYAEIGTLIPRSGGEYAYVREIFGKFPAFLILWMNVTLLAPVTVAVSGSVFATYVVKPLFPECGPPEMAVKLLAAAVILLVAAVNVVGVKFATKIQLVFTFSKLLALSIVIGVGAYHLVIHGTGSGNGAIDVFSSWERLWEDSTGDPSAVAVAILSGFWAFGGWNYLNFLTGELKRPERNLPLSILLGMAIVTIFYLLANVAYFVVLPPADMLQSAAVAVTFAEMARLPLGAVLTPLFVAASVFGAMNGQVMGSSRVYVQGAVDGQLPRALAMISVSQLTPTPALVLIAALSAFLTVFFDVFVLISYFGLVSCLMIFATLVGLLHWRRTKPEVRSPVATPIILPISMLIYVAALIVLTIKRQFWDSLVGLGIVVTGLPVYLLFLYDKDEDEDKDKAEKVEKEKNNDEKRCQRQKGVGERWMMKTTIVVQKLLGVVEQEGEERMERKDS